MKNAKPALPDYLIAGVAGLACLLWSLCAGGAEYFVATTGNDTNSGAELSPWCTLQKAANTVNAGDTVTVKDGVYTSSTDRVVEFTRGGTSDNWITFRAEHQYGAVIDGRTNSALYGAVWLPNANYTILDGFEIRDFVMGGVWLCGAASNQIHDIRIAGNWIHHMGKVMEPEAGSAHDLLGRVGGFSNPNVYNVAWERNVIHDVGRIPNPASDHNYRHDHCLYLQGKYHTVRRNVFFNMQGGFGVKIDGSSTNAPGAATHIIENNTFAFSVNPQATGHIRFWALDGGLVYPTNVVIRGNIFYKPPMYWNDAAVSALSNTVPGSVMLYSGTVVRDNITTAGSIIEETYGGAEITGKVTIANNRTLTDPLLVDAANTNFALSGSSPAIDAGTNVDLSTDFFGNPIFGRPDTGGIEYQPPYVMGVNKPDVAGNVRIYGDGKYRNTAAPGGTTADLSIIPASNDKSQWTDIVVGTWTIGGIKAWTETPGNVTGTLNCNVGDLTPGTTYVVRVNGVFLTSATANGSGCIAFSYVGGSPTNTVMVSTNGTPFDSQVPSVPSNLLATAVSASRINLSWNASTDNVGVAGYAVYRCQGTNAYARVGNATVNSFSDSNGVSPDIQYTYVVSAYDAMLNASALSASATTTSLCLPIDGAWWKYDGDVLDSSGNGNRSIARGDPVCVTGKIGRALQFNGTSQYVTTWAPSTLEMGTSDMTIAAWVRIDPAQPGTYCGIVTKGAASSSDTGYAFYYKSDTSQLAFWLCNGTTRTYPASPSGLAIKDGIWHHLAAAVTRTNNVAFYVDGASVGNSVSISSMSTDNISMVTTYLNIGQWAGANRFSGGMDDVRVYRRALPATEIMALADPDGDGMPDVDVDGDAMPDAWEIHYFEGTNVTKGAADADWDNDHLSNLQEYLAGTDPTNGMSLFEFKDLVEMPSTNMVLSWSSVSGRLYTIRYATNLLDGFTGVLQSNIVATPLVNCYTTPANQDIGGFYRIAIE